MRNYLRAANVGWSGLILDDVKQMNFTDDEMKTFRLEPGDVLLNEASGSAKEVGKPALWNGEIEDCAFQNTLLRVRSYSEADPKYLLHFFRQQAVSGEFARGSRGVGIHHLGRDALSKWRIPLPPCEEQRRIATILDYVETMRCNLSEAAAAVDEASSSASARFFEQQDPAQRYPLETVAERVVVGHVGPTSKHFTLDGIPFLRTGNVGDGSIVEDDLLRIDREFHARLAKSQLQAGDVVVSRVIGDRIRSAIIPESLDGSNCANIIIIRPSLRIRPAIITSYLSLRETQHELLGRRVGSAQSVVNTGVLKSLLVPVPSREQQDEFCQVLAAIGKLRAKINIQRRLLDELFASLQFRAFSGQL